MDDDILNYVKPKLTADQFSKFLYVFEHGKRIRPRLMQQICKHIGVPFHPLLAAASAIEIMHCASLVHDDIIDNENLRRGKEPFFLKYGSQAAILFGDLFAALSLDILLDEFQKEVHKAFIGTFRDLVEGQLMEFEPIGTVDDYYRYIDLKTGSLFKLAVQVPLLYYNFQEPRVLQFGQIFGRAFQIADDLASIGSKEYSILNFLSSEKAKHILGTSVTTLKHDNVVEADFINACFSNDG